MMEWMEKEIELLLEKLTEAEKTINKYKGIELNLLKKISIKNQKLTEANKTISELRDEKMDEINPLVEFKIPSDKMEWTYLSILDNVVESNKHFEKHDCDCHGHELRSYTFRAIEAVRDLMYKRLEKFLLTPPTETSKGAE